MHFLCHKEAFLLRPLQGYIIRYGKIYRECVREREERMRSQRTGLKSACRWKTALSTVSVKVRYNITVMWAKVFQHIWSLFFQHMLGIHKCKDISWKQSRDGKITLFASVHWQKNWRCDHQDLGVPLVTVFNDLRMRSVLQLCTNIIWFMLS